MDRKRKTIQQQFIQHCAVIIQSRWKGYIQRKRYRKFLPIYRRVKELLLSIYSGWKIRKIFKLRSIKTQIGDIKERINKGHLSQVRIAKRELIDEIARLSKKGHWIDELKRCKTSMHQSSMDDSKQNCSLYANVKSKSIKNIFKSRVQANHGKVELTKKPKMSENKPIQKIEDTKNVNNFDDIPIKITKSYCYQDDKDSQLISKKQSKNIKPMLRKSSKTKEKIAQQNLKNKTIENSIHLAKTALKNQMKSLMTNVSMSTIKEEQFSHEEALQQSIKSGSKPNQKKKIHITISKSLTNRKEEIPEKNHQLIQSQIRLSSIQKSIQLEISRLVNSKVSNKPSQRDIYVLIQAYESTYTKKKQQIKQKLSFLDIRYTKSMSHSYQNIVTKLGTHAI